MKSVIKLPEKFLFMKVGNHAGEDWEQILARKRREFEDSGMIFWGYGGTACHPISQVQPFARLAIKEQGGIQLIMHPIKSNSDQDTAEATQYSVDGRIWIKIPDGIHVTGSRYALVLDRIDEADLDLPLHELEVGIGPSLGKPAEDYLVGRTDKGCLMRSSNLRKETEQSVRKGGFVANLKSPFGVLLRRK
jgi:hypothetical protein